MKRIGAALLAALALALLPLAAAADQPVKTQQFVYSITAFDGSVYQSTFAPNAANTIYLLAGVPNVLSPRETLVYYWPLSKEYQADWLSADRLMTGNLQVLQGGTVIKSLPLVPYVVQTPSGNWQRDTALYTGPAAPAAYQKYKDSQDAYWAGVRAFDTAEAQYEQQMASLGQNGAPTDKTLPKAPVRPAAPTLDSVQPNRGYLIDLAAGNYEIRVVNDQNQIWPGSEHALAVFAPRRTGLGYNVVPQDRWTSPYASDDTNTVIYVTRPMTLYLEPYAEEEINQAAYKRLLDPQDGSGRDDVWTWIHTQPVAGGELRVASPGQGTATVPSRPYLVKQIQNTALGYTVVPYDSKTMAGTHPSFSAFKVTVQSASQPMSLTLLGGTGATVPTSQREIQAVHVSQDWLPLLPAPIVLVLGVLLRVRRGRTTRKRGEASA